MIRVSRLAWAAALFVLATSAAWGQTEFSLVKEVAAEIDWVGDRGVGEGSVGEGFASFVFDAETGTRVSLGILVTEARQGVRFTDDDSMLFLFDSSGTLLARDDDGGPGQASRIDSVTLPPSDGYYIVVTTYPNEPELTADGSFDTVEELGGSNIAFEVHLHRLDEGETGTRVRGALTSGRRGMEILQDARPIDLAGNRGAAEGIVSAGHEVFSFFVEENTSATIEVVVTDVLAGSEYRDDDSMLFLFDDRGMLVASDDDSGEGAASKLDVVLEGPQRYYAAVTTYDNTPEVDEDDRLIRFPETGESSIRFVLRIRLR